MARATAVPRRPVRLGRVAAYAVLTPNVQDSPVVVMVPVADKDRLLAALKERLGIIPEMVGGGALKLNVPLINEVYLAFANGYVYASPQAKALDPKPVVNPLRVGLPQGAIKAGG